MKRKDYEKALEILELYINKKAATIDYKISLKAPNSYKEMRKFKDENGYFLIYSGASDSTIFSSQEINIKFRAIHDKMHYENNLTFGFKDEKLLSELQASLVGLWAYNNGFTQFESFNVRDLVNAEIKGQIEYYEANGKFVENQKKYIENYLRVS